MQTPIPGIKIEAHDIVEWLNNRSLEMLNPETPEGQHRVALLKHALIFQNPPNDPRDGAAQLSGAFDRTLALNLEGRADFSGASKDRPPFGEVLQALMRRHRMTAENLVDVIAGRTEPGKGSGVTPRTSVQERALVSPIPPMEYGQFLRHLSDDEKNITDRRQLKQVYTERILPPLRSLLFGKSIALGANDRQRLTTGLFSFGTKERQAGAHLVHGEFLQMLDSNFTGAGIAREQFEPLFDHWRGLQARYGELSAQYHDSSRRKSTSPERPNR